MTTKEYLRYSANAIMIDYVEVDEQGQQEIEEILKETPETLTDEQAEETAMRIGEVLAAYDTYGDTAEDMAEEILAANEILIGRF